MEGRQQERLHHGFVVPKKIGDISLKGVADMRGVNSQTRRLNNPLS